MKRMQSNLHKGNVERYLKMSVINAVFTLKKYQNKYPEKQISEIINLIEASKSYLGFYDYETAKTLYAQMDFTVINDIKDFIAEILLLEQPTWLLQVPFGRELVIASLIDNEYQDIIQCFSSAGLFEKHPNKEVVDWWDKLAGLVRKNQDEENLRIGRLGEILSFNYERERLIGIGIGIEPKWVSIENNFAGYDILSYQVDENSHKKIMIEVKASKSFPISFFISKNEWKIAKDFGDNFIFHVWYLPKKELYKLKVQDVEPNIPIDSGNGNWQSVLIRID